MNLKAFKNIFLAGALIIGAASCTDEFEEINTNPNIPELPTASRLFTFTQLTVSGVGHETSRVNSLSTGMLGMHYTGAWGDSFLWMQGNAQVWVGEYWKKAYVKIIGNLEVAKQMATEEGASDLKQQLAILDIWKVYTMHRMTDLYGHIPYSQAGKAFTEQVLHPEYDKQSVIYADMITTLGTAIETLSSGNSFAEADVVFNGDHAKWEKFANSLRLRLATRIGDQTAISASLNAPLIESNDDIAVIPFTGEGDTWNLASNGDAFSLAWGGVNPSAAYLNILTQRDDDATNDDPRIERFFRNDANGDGTPTDWNAPTLMMGEQGAGNADFTLNTDYVGYFDTDDILISPAEVAFLKAEATSDLATKKNLYKEGIQRSLEYYEVSSAEADHADFWTAVLADFDADPSAAILKQKWVSLIGNGPEAYAEVRRNFDTFFGTIFIAGEDYVDEAYRNAQTPDRQAQLTPIEGNYMLKIAYPVEEYATNGANVEEAASDNTGFWWE